MKRQQLFKEKIKRTRVLFKELGYKLGDIQSTDDCFSAAFKNSDNSNGGIFIDNDCNFLELLFTFSFSQSMSDFIKDRLENMLDICYEYGCYINFQKADQEFAFSIFSKIYFTGLNYYSLKDSMNDFSDCIETLTEIIDIQKDKEKGEDE